MKYTVEISKIYVVGRLWMGGRATMPYRLTQYDVQDIAALGGINRNTVQVWLDVHAGDFQCVDDFYADLEYQGETVILDWENEESEMFYNDCMGED
jgi:hypothetical protein